jgi:hypothetical protein
LRHFANAVFEATDPGGTDWVAWWAHLAYLALWGALAAVLAWRLFHRSETDIHHWGRGIAVQAASRR